MTKRKQRKQQLDAARKAKEQKCRSKNAKKMQLERKSNRWRRLLEEFNGLADTLKNPQGHSRTFEENKMILLALRAALNRRISLLNVDQETTINWRSIEDEVGRDFHVSNKYVHDLRTGLFEDGDVWVFGQTESRGMGAASVCDKNHRAKVQPEHFKEVAKFVDGKHCKGSTVVARNIIAFLLDKFELKIHRRTVGRLMNKMGLTWSAYKPVKRTFAAHRKKVLREFLIELDKYERMMNGDDSEYVYVFMDESYVNIGHGNSKSYMSSDKDKQATVRKKSGKGKRLIILHAITVDGPLAEQDENGIYVNDLQWRGDTPHPVERADGRLTCETLWVAQSHSGDYHDNMNSNMFMKWVQEKLVPCFERKYPNKKMILVADNAPYHHAREIGSLASLTKKQIVSDMVKYGVDYLDLPLISEERFELIGLDGDDDHPDVQDRGNCVRIAFNKYEQVERSSRSRPRIASLEELKIAYVTWLKEHRKDLLACKIEGYLQDRGHIVLWTPPYCPELQPIEMFWGCGKNHVALNHCYDMKMKDVVRYLREGWYGNGEKHPPGHPLRKQKVDCCKLWMHCLKDASTKFVPLCGGLEGSVGSLIVDESYKDGEVSIPIDTLVVDLTRNGLEVDEVGQAMNV